MPYITTKTNIQITEEQEAHIQKQFGEAIRLLDKEEKWLMMDFQDNKRMYFRGKRDLPVCFVEIKLFGKAEKSAYEQMTHRVTEIISSELGVNGTEIYVQYEEADHWGFNGTNF